MSDFLNAFGRIFVFGTFLPGMTGYLLIQLLFNNILPTEANRWFVAIGLIYGIGFVANAIGHAVEVCIEIRWGNTKYGNFCQNIYWLCKSEKLDITNMYSFYQYAEDICIWYWNSALIIIIIMMLRLITYIGKSLYFSWDIFLVFIMASFIAVALFYTTCKVRNWIKDAVGDFTKRPI